MEPTTVRTVGAKHMRASTEFRASWLMYGYFCLLPPVNHSAPQLAWRPVLPTALCLCDGENRVLPDSR